MQLAALAGAPRPRRGQRDVDESKADDGFGRRPAERPPPLPGPADDGRLHPPAARPGRAIGHSDPALRTARLRPAPAARRTRRLRGEDSLGAAWAAEDRWTLAASGRGAGEAVPVGPRGGGGAAREM